MISKGISGAENQYHYGNQGHTGTSNKYLDQYGTGTYGSSYGINWIPYGGNQYADYGIGTQGGGARTPMYKKGGIVPKTGTAIVHKGEMVVPVKDVAKTKKAMKKAKVPVPKKQSCNGKCKY
tara:strand:- start:1011 stop:1376 length:366 start_codon:yes stop_codon:yes gene_type:complete